MYLGTIGILRKPFKNSVFLTALESQASNPGDKSLWNQISKNWIYELKALEEEKKKKKKNLAETCTIV
jgi:hypothetical protein